MGAGGRRGDVKHSFIESIQFFSFVHHGSSSVLIEESCSGKCCTSLQSVCLVLRGASFSAFASTKLLSNAAVCASPSRSASSCLRAFVRASSHSSRRIFGAHDVSELEVVHPLQPPFPHAGAGLRCDDFQLNGSGETRPRRLVGTGRRTVCTLFVAAAAAVVVVVGGG